MDRSNWTPYNNNHYYSQMYQEDAQHTAQPEAGQTSAGVPTNWALGSHSAPIPSSPGTDLEYLLRTPQPTTLEEAILPFPQQNVVEDISHNNELPDPQPTVKKQGRKPRKKQPPIKERFLAGLKAFEQGASLKDCASSFQFRDYITTNGRMVKRGGALYRQLTAEEKTRLDQAIIARKGAKVFQLADKDTTAERFLAGLDKYAQGIPLRDCSATLGFRLYVSDDGRLQKAGQYVYASLRPEDQAQVDKALDSRNRFYRERVATEQRFLAGLDNYAQGVPLVSCSATLRLGKYLSTDGYLQESGQSLYNRLSLDDKVRVDQALTARGKRFTQGAAKDVATFMAALKPYASGLTLQECGTQSGLKRKANTYLTAEGGLTSKGNRLIENLQPDQRNEVWNAIGERQLRTESNLPVPESPWQWPDTLPSMMDMEAVNPAAMAGPTQTENMWATVWQLTGQTMQGRLGIPSELAEPRIDYAGSDAVEEDFQHQYGPDGLLP
ncbi:MAG: hypothetical protein P8X74_06685 [Reinekea sp.]